jgi:hypothetical protein
MSKLEGLMLSMLVALTLAEGLTHFGQAYVDSPGYMQVTQFIRGRAVITEGVRFRLLRPIVPFLAAVLSAIMQPRLAFAFVNLVLWCASAILMFYFTKLFTKNKYAAFASSVFFTASIPLIIFGAAVYTDMAGYFFILLGSYLILRWDIPRANFERTCVASVVTGLGIISRESVACVMIFMLVWGIVSRGSVLRIVLYEGIIAVFALIWSTLVGVSYTAWYLHGGVNMSSYAVLGLGGGIIGLFRSLLYAFGEIPIVLTLVLLGVLQTYEIPKLKKFGSLMLSELAVIVAWPVIGTRFTFILFPALLPLAGIGIDGAYTIIFGSPIVASMWPSLAKSPKTRVVFVGVILAAYVVITNVVTKGFISLPWHLYTDPSITPSNLQWVTN